MSSQQSTHRSRSGTYCPLIGYSRDLPSSKLPTKADVLRYYIFIRNENLHRNSCTTNDVSRKVAKRLFSFWKDDANVKPKTEDEITAMVKRLYTVTYKKGEKHWVRKQSNRMEQQSVKSRIAKFKSYSEKLFDIARCQSKLADKCRCDTCLKLMIPDDVLFLHDQRTTRSRNIEYSVHQEGTEELNNNIANADKSTQRREKDKSRLNRSTVNPYSRSSFVSHDDNDDNLPDMSPPNDPDYDMPSPPKKLNIPMDTFVLAALASGVSQEKATNLFNSLVYDLGGNASDMASRTKVQKRMEKRRKVVNEESEEELRKNPPVALFFDDKTDNDTLQCEMTEFGTLTRKPKPVKHCTMARGEDGRFIASLTIPHSGDDETVSIWNAFDYKVN